MTAIEKPDENKTKANGIVLGNVFDLVPSLALILMFAYDEDSSISGPDMEADGYFVYGVIDKIK